MKYLLIVIISILTSCSNEEQNLETRSKQATNNSQESRSDDIVGQKTEGDGQEGRNQEGRKTITNIPVKTIWNQHHTTTIAKEKQNESPPLPPSEPIINGEENRNDRDGGENKNDRDEGEGRKATEVYTPQVLKLIETHCVRCHNPMSPFGDTVSDLSKVREPADFVEAGLVVAGRPDDSSIYRRLIHSKASSLPSEKNMPSGNAGDWSEADADLFYDWIASMEEVQIDCEDEDLQTAMAQRVHRRLSREELLRIVQQDFIPDLTNQERQSLTNAMGAEFQSGYPTFASSVIISSRKTEEMFAFAEIFAGLYQKRYINNCSNISCYRGRLENFLNKFLPLNIHKETRDIYLENFSKLYNTYSSQPDLIKTAATQTIIAAFLSPKLMLNSDPYPAWVRARRIALTVTGRLPDETLVNSVKQGQFTDETLVEEQIRRLLLSNSAGFFFKTFVENWLAMTRPDLSSGESGLDNSDVEAAVNELFEFFRYQVINNRPLYSLIDSSVSPHHSKANRFYKGFKVENQLTVPAATEQRSGAKTLPAVMMTYGEPSVVTRGLKIMNAFMCETTAPPPVDPAEEAESLSLTFTDDQVENARQRRKIPACASCHVKIDPVGLIFLGFDEFGRHHNAASSEIPDDLVLKRGDFTAKNPLELAELIKKEGQFGRCFANHVMSYSLWESIDYKKSGVDYCRVEKLIKFFNVPGTTPFRYYLIKTIGEATKVGAN